MKDQLCKAFCQDLKVMEVPAGWAVSTGFDAPGGDPIGFYIVKGSASDRFRIEDDGSTVPMLEASGFDLTNETRQKAFQDLLAEHAVAYDPDSMELRTPDLAEREIPHAAMRFVALLLRMSDLLLLSKERVASTFKDDAKQAIRAMVGDRAMVEEDAAVSDTLAEFSADLVLRAPNRDPVAVYLASSDQRLWEAMLHYISATYEYRVRCSVIAVLERDTSVSPKLRRRAQSRLTTLLGYRGDETSALKRIEHEVFGYEQAVH